MNIQISDTKSPQITLPNNLTIEKKFSYFPKKDQAIDFLQNSKNKDYRLFSEDVIYYQKKNITKKYIVATEKSIFNWITHKNANIYECFELNQPVKLFIDVDYKTKIYDSMKLSKLADDMIKNSINIINTELLKYGFKNPSIMVLKSHLAIRPGEENKISAHIIYQNVVFKDISYMKLFFLTIQSDLITKKIIDPSVYKVGSLRIMHCTKMGKDNKLRYYKGINYIKPENDAFANEQLFYDSLVTHVTKPPNIDIEKAFDKFVKKNIKLVKDNKINPKNVSEPKFLYYFTDNELDELESLAKRITPEHMNNYSQWIVITYAFIDLFEHVEDKDFKKQIKRLWIKLCSQSESYNAVENEKYFQTLKLDFITANYIPSVVNSSFRFNKYIPYKLVKPDFSKYTNILENDQFINPSLKDKLKDIDVLAAASPTGSGKTTLLENIFNIHSKKVFKYVF
jgi:hypothetical protein